MISIVSDMLLMIGIGVGGRSGGVMRGAPLHVLIIFSNLIGLQTILIIMCTHSILLLFIVKLSI